MRTFPVFLRVENKPVVIIGGGEQAAQKSRLILKTSADVTVMSSELDPELAALVAERRIKWTAGEVTVDSLRGAVLIFVATGCRGADAALSRLASEAGAIVNVVDAPEFCDAITPSIVDRDPLVVAIGTEGNAPVLGRIVKTQIEAILEPNLGALASLAGRMRAAVALYVAKDARRDYWRWVFSSTPRQLHQQGSERGAAELMKRAIFKHGAPDGRTSGVISYVAAGPADRDLITMRGVQRLQDADIIFYKELPDPTVLEYARRDAERVYIGDLEGVHSWPGVKIDTLLLSEARAGKQVVCLTGGDPQQGALRCREALRLAGDTDISCEIVPGVQSAAIRGGG